MKGCETRKQRYDHTCFRCGGVIEAGEKMVTLSVTVETPVGDDVVEVVEAGAVSTLCTACASILLSQAIACDPSLMMPLPKGMLSEEEGDTSDHINSQNSSEPCASEQDEYDDTILADFYFLMGVDALQEKDWEKAITAFTSCLEIEPDNALAYDRRGIAYGRDELHHEAITDFTRAIELEPDFAGAYNNRGLSCYRLGRFDQAIADYDTAIELSPEVAVFYANRGLAHRWRNDLHVAIADFSKAIELEPTLPETHNNRGEAHAELGEYEKATADFEHELSLNPGDIVAYANHAAAVAGGHGTRES